MSKDQLDHQDPEQQEETFINQNEVGEIVPEDDGLAPAEDSDEEMDGEDQEDDMADIVVDLANNSSTYFDPHQDSVYLVASHPTLPLVVSGGGDNLGYVWTTHSHPPKIAAKLTGHTESIVAGGFTGDGKYLVTGDMSGQLRVWKSKSGGEKWEFSTSVHEVEEIVWIRFHPTLPVIAVGAQDGSVWVYELGPKFATLAVLNAHSLPTNAGVFVDTDNTEQLTLITVSEDASIICWDVYQSTARYTLGPKELRGVHPWVSVCLSPSGKTIAAGSQDGILAILKVENGALLNFIDTSAVGMEEDAKSVEAVAWSSTLNLVAVGDVEGRVQLYDVARWQVRTTLQLKDAVTKLAFIDGTPYLIASGMDGSLAVFDGRSGQLVWNCQGHNAGILGFAVQNNGNRLISAGDEGVCLVFDRENAQPQGQAQGQPLLQQ